MARLSSPTFLPPRARNAPPRYPAGNHAGLPSWARTPRTLRRPISTARGPPHLIHHASAAPNPRATALASLRRTAPLRRCCHATSTHRSSGQAAQKHRLDVPVVPSFREASFMFYASAYSVSDIFVINIINNIRIHFIISFYVICAVIYCSFCCIYV